MLEIQKLFVKNTGNCSSADAISELNPRVIDDARARKLASDLKRCSYYETCATYGLNVERVFQDGNNFTNRKSLNIIIL